MQRHSEARQVVNADCEETQSRHEDEVSFAALDDVFLLDDLPPQEDEASPEPPTAVPTPVIQRPTLFDDDAPEESTLRIRAISARSMPSEPDDLELHDAVTVRPAFVHVPPEARRSGKPSPLDPQAASAIAAAIEAELTKLRDKDKRLATALAYEVLLDPPSSELSMPPLPAPPPMPKPKLTQAFLPTTLPQRPRTTSAGLWVAAALFATASLGGFAVFRMTVSPTGDAPPAAAAYVHPAAAAHVHVYPEVEPAAAPAALPEAPAQTPSAVAPALAPQPPPRASAHVPRYGSWSGAPYRRKPAAWTPSTVHFVAKPSQSAAAPAVRNKGPIFGDQEEHQ